MRGQVTVDLDATLVTAHSAKEGFEPNFKRGYGFAPMCAFVDHGEHGTGEALAVDLRPGKASPWNSADPIALLDAACFDTNTQLSAGWRLADLEARHRERARCDDRIRGLKDTGLRNLPFNGYAGNRIWVEVVALAADLLVRSQTRPSTRTSPPEDRSRNGSGSESSPWPDASLSTTLEIEAMATAWSPGVIAISGWMRTLTGR